MIENIVYRDIDDKSLISFCLNNLTNRAKFVLGIFVDTDGVVKIEKERYPELVAFYLEAGAVSNGKFNLKLDFELPLETNRVM